MVRELISEDVAIIQLPCPEVAHLGMRRWGMTREQYDVPAYRRLCSRLAEPVVDTLTELVGDGCEIVGVWGVDGSPSCGVEVTCEGFSGGELESLGAIPSSAHVPGEGVFLSILREACSRAGLDVSFRAVAEEE